MIKYFVNEKGFTLMELLIAVAIVVILAAVGIPVYLTFMGKAKATEASVSLAGIKMGEDGYKLTHGIYAACGVAGNNPPNGESVTWVTMMDPDDPIRSQYGAINFSIAGDILFAYEVGLGDDNTTFLAGALGDTNTDGNQILYIVNQDITARVVTGDDDVADLAGLVLLGAANTDTED